MRGMSRARQPSESRDLTGRLQDDTEQYRNLDVQVDEFVLEGFELLDPLDMVDGFRSALVGLLIDHGLSVNSSRTDPSEFAPPGDVVLPSGGSSRDAGRAVGIVAFERLTLK